MSSGELNYSAYVPCFNNAATIRAAVEGVLAQSLPPAEVLVLDDGSSDGSAERLAGLPVRIVRHKKNLGRGATRARAMRETRHEWVLCSDATNVLERDFVAKAAPWTDDPRVAAVFGVFRAGELRTTAERWRARHLFKIAVPRVARSDALLATTGAWLRRSALAAVGGFDPALRHTEDGVLGERLLTRGFSVVCDPAIGFVSIARNSVPQVLERYWRWHAGPAETVAWSAYGRNVGYALKHMAREDLRAGDWRSAMVSLLCPHYQFWKSWSRRRWVKTGREYERER